MSMRKKSPALKRDFAKIKQISSLRDFNSAEKLFEDEDIEQNNWRITVVPDFRIQKSSLGFIN